MQLRQLFQLLLILFGSFSAAILVRQTFGLPTGTLFFSVFELLNNAIGTMVMPIEMLVLAPLRHHLAKLGIPLTLEPHWKYAFVLMWLYFSASKKVNAPTDWGVSYRTALAFVPWLISGAIALCFGVLTGLSNINSAAAFWWPASGFFFAAAAARWWNTIANPKTRSGKAAQFGAIGTTRLLLGLGCAAGAAYSQQFLAASVLWLFWLPFFLMHAESLVTSWGRFAWRALSKRDAPQPTLRFYSLLGALTYFLLLVDPMSPVNEYIATLPSPGLASFLLAVCLEALLQMVWGYQRREGQDDSGSLSWLGDRATRLGIQVLSVLGGALLIALLAAELP